MSLIFSESEIKMLSRAWLCVDGGMPKIDYDRLAQECGLAKSSANVLWNKLRRKLESANENGGATAAGGDGDAAATPKKKTPKKKTPKKEADGTDATPKKRGRKSKAEMAAIAAAAENGDEDDEEMGSAKKKVKEEEGTGLIEADSDDEA
ncbi:hypothetical protein M409DRAFT_19955 [Zasmidium cellare ATCC 36951]|uniref:Uncharacterized protein n=1 Tax=Zasmidium cellare ATCC 36951 TaxID=1080233 RepID=A0A6A6CS60_ZASCE|nr:uncharacterized protein M409DRAFT_19955 [Zasmidium cellare ATCC 36951]KAF2169543.1 hypothetical protein M409DRAFT_19955 [Zasmidium cellare ATCC 36951]